VAHINVHIFGLKAECLASEWEDSYCTHRDYIDVVATATFYIDEDKPSDIHADLKANASSELAKHLVFKWVDDCRDQYIEMLTETES
tara:strand:+ start:475 stop:735 length:261 start_codon:yes stop_codon:yes gene_type:complete